MHPPAKDQSTDFSELDERTLVARAQEGEEKAIAELLSRYQGRIYRFGMRMCSGREDAEDVLQETLLAMARSIRTFRGASSLSTWLYSIARSQCIKKRARERRNVDVALGVNAPGARSAAEDDSPLPDQVVSDAEIGNILNHAISSLDDGQREVLVLRDVEGLSAGEVADVVGVSVDAVKSRLHRARLAVRERVAPHLAEFRTPAPREAACPDVLMLFSRHQEGEISADLCAEMEKHLETCAGCRDACGSLQKTLALCHASTAPHVPDALQESVRHSLREILLQK
ncbi:MAG: sigma-70 family RNA polymerase sigma factor [Sandaracinaceae bacterium]|nr:sigma-70 family RNA polymerase sigma factor [Sandaracinaceae bacterium]